MFVFLFLAIGIGLLSLSAPTIIMTNAQGPSNTTSSSNNSTSNETRATQMGICVVGVTSPCNRIVIHHTCRDDDESRLV